MSAQLSESEFLKTEAEQAKAAVSTSLQKAKAALDNSVNPFIATRKHPLIAVGTAAAAGFVVTVLAIPSREERELRHLERLRRAMNPQHEDKPPVDSKTSSNGSHSDKPTIWMMVLREAIAFLKPILLAQLTSNVRAEAVPREPDSSNTAPDSTP